MAGGERLKILQIPHPAGRIPRSQPLVESGIALADMMPAFAEGSMNYSRQAFQAMA